GFWCSPSRSITKLESRKWTMKGLARTRPSVGRPIQSRRPLRGRGRPLLRDDTFETWLTDGVPKRFALLVCDGSVSSGFPLGDDSCAHRWQLSAGDQGFLCGTGGFVEVPAIEV